MGRYSRRAEGYRVERRNPLNKKRVYNQTCEIGSSGQTRDSPGSSAIRVSDGFRSGVGVGDFAAVSLATPYDTLCRPPRFGVTTLLHPAVRQCLRLHQAFFLSQVTCGSPLAYPLQRHCALSRFWAAGISLIHISNFVPLLAAPASSASPRETSAMIHLQDLGADPLCSVVAFAAGAEIVALLKTTRYDRRHVWMCLRTSFASPVLTEIFEFPANAASRKHHVWWSA